MFNLINIGERAGSGIPNIFSVWSKQGWAEPVIKEAFEPERTTLILTASAKERKIGDKKSAIKIGDKCGGEALDHRISDRPRVGFLRGNSLCDRLEGVADARLSEGTCRRGYPRGGGRKPQPKIPVETIDTAAIDLTAEILRVTRDQPIFGLIPCYSYK